MGTIIENNECLFVFASFENCIAAGITASSVTRPVRSTYIRNLRLVVYLCCCLDNCIWTRLLQSIFWRTHVAHTAGRRLLRTKKCTSTKRCHRLQPPHLKVLALKGIQRDNTPPEPRCHHRMLSQRAGFIGFCFDFSCATRIYR